MASAQLLRACCKAAVLYALFLLIYEIIQPVAGGHLPSLYQALGRGRARFITDLEPNIDLLLHDHMIQQATHDTWNVVMLGSSEVYGLYDVPDKALPMALDRLGLQTQDGRSVRVYNLSYPIPDAAKDLLIADRALRSGLPIDAMILNVNAWSFAPVTSHALLALNPGAAIRMIDAYDLLSTEFADLPPAPDHSFPTDVPVLRGWLAMQLDFLRWTTVRIDNRGNGPQTMLGIETGVNPALKNTRLDVLRAFRQLSDSFHVPVLLINVPRTFSQDEFLPWLYIESTHQRLPLLDCEFVFDDVSLFLDSIHLRPQTDPLYARILAQQFSQPEMSAVSPQMPLRLPPDVVTPEGQKGCEFLPLA